MDVLFLAVVKFFDDEVAQPTQSNKDGEQGHALMLLLFCLGHQWALRAIVGELQAGGRLFAFLDCTSLANQRELQRSTGRFGSNCGCTPRSACWNKAGIFPAEWKSFNNWFRPLMRMQSYGEETQLQTSR